MTLKAQLETLPPELLRHLETYGFRAERLQAWADSMSTDRDQRNRLRGKVEPVPSEQIATVPEPGTADHERLAAIGLEAIAKGQLAICIMAGGMATRMGGVVKALVEVCEGKTFMDIRLDEVRAIRERHGGAPLPVWLMTSAATRGPITEALGDSLDGEAIGLFAQDLSLRLNPDQTLYLDGQGEPSLYATGHGDLPEALRRSGLLERFTQAGGRYVWLSNLDNLGASVDPAVLGWHIAHGGPLTVELVDKHPGDTGGGPVSHDGAPIIAEHFRLPLDFDAETVPVFNTNTFLVGAQALSDLDMDWTYVEVHKKREGRTVVQFERLLGELTVAVEPRFLRVSRDGVGSRFLPVKDREALKEKRSVLTRIARMRAGED